EREERIGGGHRTTRALRALGEGVGPLDGELAGVHAVHLPHADPHGGAVVGEQDRVGLGGPHGAPGEGQVGQGLLVRGVTGRKRPGGGVVAGGIDLVALLHQHAAGDLLGLDRDRAGVTQHQHADVLLALQHFQRAVGVSGGDDHLGEHAGDLFGHFYRDLGVGRDHAAEGGDRVAGVRLGVRLGDRGAHGDAARVGVFDDGHGGRLALVVGGAPGGVGVHVVVVAHRLAVQLLGGGQPGGTTGVGVQGGLLVGVLAVAQRGGALPGGAGPGGQRGIVGSVSVAGLGPAGSLELGAHPGGHVHVVGGGVP